MLDVDLKALSREELQGIIWKIQEFLSEEQEKRLQEIVQEYHHSDEKSRPQLMQERMSQELVDEKMRQIEKWKQQIDDGELYLDTEEYEDYSSGYWDADWVTDYYDNHGVGDKIMSMIRFAKDCVDDRKYREANEIYEWLWEMSVSTDSEYSDPVDLEMMDENDLIHKAAAGIAAYVGFTDTKEEKNLMEFEREILEESREHKVSEFWNYFQRWKRYFPMDENEKKRYLAWAEKIVYGRADAIVSGQHRNHYGQVAILLAMVGEIKESMGDIGARRIIFAEYQRKFPRHSSFQREMKHYFNEV